MPSSKVNRIIKIYDMPQKGNSINKLSLAEEFNVDERSIRRDISDIKKYLNFQDYGRFILKNEGGMYSLEDKQNEIFDKCIFLISKILLDSRAFNKQEKGLILKCLMEKVSSKKRKVIEKFIRNENYNYVELEHKSSLIDKIWELIEYISKQEIIFIKYEKMNGDIVYREFSPLGIVFSEFYFYVLGNYKDSNRTIVLRVDRIIEFKGTNKKYKVNYATRLQEGEFKKRIQFMYSGNMKRIKFIFKNGSIEAVKDRFPTARIKLNEDGSYLVNVEVIGEGIIMWFLSQGSKVKVLEPREVVLKIEEEINKMQENYN